MIRDDDIYGSTNENKTYPTLALKKGDKPPPQNFFDILSFRLVEQTFQIPKIRRIISWCHRGPKDNLIDNVKSLSILTKTMQ